jgi:hypothetical protein
MNADYQLDWTRDLKPEIGLGIKLVVFKYSFFGSNTASPGASLQNLKLVNRYGSRRKLSFYVVSSKLMTKLQDGSCYYSYYSIHRYSRRIS